MDALTEPQILDAVTKLINFAETNFPQIFLGNLTDVASLLGNGINPTLNQCVNACQVIDDICKAIIDHRVDGPFFGEMNQDQRIAYLNNLQGELIAIGNVHGVTMIGQSSKGKSSKVSNNAKCIDKLQSTPESAGWTMRTWATYLKCSVSTVHALPAIKAIQLKRDSVRYFPKPNKKTKNRTSK